MTNRYVIGIDLGTTNSVLAYAKISGEAERSKIGEIPVEILPIPQYVAPGTIESRKSLPSFVYLPTEKETPQYESAFADRTADSRTIVVGEAARRRSSEVPDRSISAAKSWLCHSKVDRRAPILPWGAADEIGKLSPLDVSRAILRRLIGAWESAFSDSPIAEQQVVLTVPASFDAGAKELTHEAAVAAGLPEEKLLFLEEPQAAVYSWLREIGENWRKTLRVGDKLLVCDVGGGTTDLSLIGVEEEGGDLTLRRLAVGNHLLVGGDNMDLALAHFAAELLAEKGTKLDAWQSTALWHSAREAKESLLSQNSQTSHKLSVLGRGAKLIGGSASADVPRDRVAELLTDGFFPKVSLTDKPKRRSGSGFREIGLPFEQDSAITKHLAAFLTSQSAVSSQAGENAVCPTHVLLNGGVFRAAALEMRFFEAIADWFPAQPPQRLCPSFELDYAVARGAAYYGASKELGGIRIRGGTARAYYVGIETAGLAIPGAPRPLKALCVAPFGMEEGTECEVPSDEFYLTVGEPATFRFFSSTTRRNDAPGTLLDSSYIAAADKNDSETAELDETDSLEASLPREDLDEEEAPVKFKTRITELGILELWSQSTESDKRWKLEFSVREENE
ncbi:MAG: Hsp70 family protein [Planctomycetaceae bacterium]|nr:Hsp70 family protein [Planctomycetaceae bacterium]